MNIKLREQEFTLLAEKALYRHSQSLLVIADVHLGKVNHFRKEGISIPARSQMGDYDNLKSIFEKIKPEKVFFLGDLFHSTVNKDWHHFDILIKQFPAIAFTLIKGNHDLVNNAMLEQLNIAVVNYVEDEHFVYTHQPTETKNGKVNIAGHIHPGVKLSGMANQSVKLPCFYCAHNIFLLPAFGVLTGLYMVDKHPAAEIFAVVADKVRRL